MHLFPLALLVEGDGAQDRRQNHAWPMNPSQRLVNTDLAATLCSRNSWRANREVCAHEIEIAGRRSQREVQIAVGSAGTSSSRTERRGDCGNQRYSCDQAEP